MANLVQHNPPSLSLISNFDQCDHQVLRPDTFAPETGPYYAMLLIIEAIN